MVGDLSIRCRTIFTATAQVAHIGLTPKNRPPPKGDSAAQGAKAAKIRPGFHPGYIHLNYI